MKYAKILGLLFFMIYFCQCRKINSVFDYYNSFDSIITGTVNGKTWKKNNWFLLGIFKDINPTLYTNSGDSSTYASCLVNDDRFTLTLSQFNEQKELRETLFILGLSKKKGRFAVIPRVFQNCDIKDSISVNFSTSTADGDVAKDLYYKIDTKNANNVEITDFKSKQVKGTFDIKLIMTRRRDEPGSIYPDTLHLKGSFDVKK